MFIIPPWASGSGDAWIADSRHALASHLLSFLEIIVSN
jgi:hypothetical protein